MSVEDRIKATSMNPIVVMVGESTGEQYARAASSKGVGAGRENEWLIKDMSEEVASWGHPGGEGGHIILKSDGEVDRGSTRCFGEVPRRQGDPGVPAQRRKPA